MNFLTWILLAMAVIAPLALCWIVFIQIPGLAHSSYRHELWDIHDGILEEVHAGRLRPGRTVLGLLDDIDALIWTSSSQTILRFMLALRTLRDVRVWHEPLHLGDDISTDEREYLQAIIDRLLQASSRHLRTGSVVGWALALLEPFVRAGQAEQRVVEVYSGDVAPFPAPSKSGYLDGPHLRPVP